MRLSGSRLWSSRSMYPCHQSIAQIAHVMFKPRLRNHRMLAQTGGELGFNGMESGDGGRPKGVPLEIPTSCCDNWLSRATVCSLGSGDNFLWLSMTNSETVIENRPVCRQMGEKKGGGGQIVGNRARDTGCAHKEEDALYRTFPAF